MSRTLPGGRDAFPVWWADRLSRAITLPADYLGVPVGERYVKSFTRSQITKMMIAQEKSPAMITATRPRSR